MQCSISTTCSRVQSLMSFIVMWLSQSIQKLEGRCYCSTLLLYHSTLNSHRPIFSLSHFLPTTAQAASPLWKWESPKSVGEGHSLLAYGLSQKYNFPEISFWRRIKSKAFLVKFGLYEEENFDYNSDRCSRQYALLKKIILKRTRNGAFILPLFPILMIPEIINRKIFLLYFILPSVLFQTSSPQNTIHSTL